MVEQLPDHVPSLKEAMKQDKAEFDDCMPCRVIGTCGNEFDHLPTPFQDWAHPFQHLTTGTATFLGLGAFTYISGHAQIQANAAAIKASKSIFGMRSRRAAITGTSAVMVGLGVYRWFS
ncbi:hypothetical protein IAQ61_010992 [Plenodomus lingam]|uniref:uncharacterized protein n=1 Tax=Leptosphaeria maculans TaxID=5022 RepID=UPI0033304FFE|nr:hypothetical protein IAQ61_010992 [Plenodomus lingam]